MKRTMLNTALLLAMLYAITVANQVGPPEVVFHQGRLTDHLGNPVVDGNYDMIFRMYDAATGGNLQWAETTSVAVLDGLFSVKLGSDHPLTGGIFSGVDPDWLELSVNGETLLQRTEMVSTPYSLNTARVTGDIQTSPGEILFQGTGNPDTHGVLFVDTASGVTVARYGTAKVVYVPSPGPGPDIPHRTSYGLTGTEFTGVYPTPGLAGGTVYMDTTGDTLVQYGPGGIVWVQPQPEPPLPAEASIGSYGLVFKDVGPNHVRYGPAGVVMLNSVGDTTVEIASGRMEVEATVEITGELTVEDNSGNPQVVVKQDGTVELASSARLGPSGLILGTMTPNKTEYGNGTMLMINASGDTTLRIAGGELELESTLTITGELTVADNSGNPVTTLKNDGTMKVAGRLAVEGDAGPSTAIAIGDRYRDNAIVAWGRVSGAGALSNEFGVVSVAHPTTGTYTVTIDDTTSLAGNFIAMVVPEVDGLPTTAATIRLAYVDQSGSIPFNKFTVYMINGSFAATDDDFLFMVTGR